jgi:hypothetical protein
MQSSNLNKFQLPGRGASAIDPVYFKCSNRNPCPINKHIEREPPLKHDKRGMSNHEEIDERQFNIEYSTVKTGGPNSREIYYFQNVYCSGSDHV